MIKRHPTILFLLLLHLCGSCTLTRSEPNSRVRSGHIDLSGWDLKQGPSQVELRGDWKFIPGEFVPSSAEDRWAQARTLTLPGSWANAYQGEGTISLRADITLPEAADWGLYINDAPSAIEVWANGERIGASGRIGIDAESTVPSRQPVQIRLPKAGHLQIVLFMSNFSHSRGGIYYPITIANYDVFDYNLRVKQVMEAGFAASIFVIGLFHAFLFVIRREQVTLVFAFCCLAVALRLACSNMRIFDLFVPTSWATSYRLEFGSLYLIAPLTEAFIGLLFPLDYPKKLIPWRIAWYTGVIASLFFPVSIITRFIWIAHVGHLVGVGITLYTLGLARLRQRVGIRWITAGTLCLFAFSLIDIVYFYREQTGSYTLHIGFLVFILFQAGAIARNYTAIQMRMMEEEAMRKHSYRQLGKVLYPHQLLMMEGGHNLEDTMPTGPGRGCVLCFDVIGSTAVKHINKNQVIKKFFTHCYEVMMENYSTSTLSANAYRLKEMGDGFLCSVGYPFKVPDGSNEAAFATRLALRFISIFEEHVKAMDYPLPIHCAVGIAGGDLEGFYPESGTREYDLYGRAVVLATRYESMRKHLFHGTADASMLIIQEEIFLSLPTDLRKRFQEFDLVQHKLKVRDDPSARVLYYAMVAKEQNILYQGSA